MYNFNDKWRQRLLEDALVADLFDGLHNVHTPAKPAGKQATTTATPGTRERAEKRAA